MKLHKSGASGFLLFGASMFVLTVHATAVYGHGGGLDKNGCHRNNKEGNYHCHRGPDTGKSFPSKEAYERAKKEE